VVGLGILCRAATCGQPCPLAERNPGGRAQVAALQRLSATIFAVSEQALKTSVIYCGDCLEELKRLPDCCIDRDFRKELEYIRMLGGG